MFPIRLKSGSPARIPVSHLFLHQLDGRHKIVYALMVYAIYAVHNDFRHNANKQDFTKCVYRVPGDVNVRLEIRRAVWDILGPF